MTTLFEDFTKQEPSYGSVKDGRPCDAVYSGSPAYHCRRLKGRHRVHSAIVWGERRDATGSVYTGQILWTDS